MIGIWNDGMSLYDWEKDNYEQIIEQFRSCLNLLNAEYIHLEHRNAQSKKALFASGIVKILLQHVSILKFLNRLSKKDLVDSLVTHNNKYVEILKQDNADLQMISLFQSNVKILINSLGSRTNDSSDQLTKEELNTIRDNVKNLAHKCQTLFAEQSYNQEIIDKLQASAIAFNIPNLSIKQQTQLQDKLLLIKELWQFNNVTNLDEDNFILLFHLNPKQVLQGYELTDINSVFDKIIDLFIDDNSIIENLTNEQLISLYDRLKNLELESESINSLLQKIYIEAQYRYKDRRMTDSEVELLKRFQNLDNITNQIENAEYALGESFLIKNSSFAQETLIFIAKHTDNIKAVGAIKAPLLNDILTKIKSEFSLEQPSDTGSASVIIMLSLIKSKFLSDTESHIRRRYSDLDKFAINSLKNKYVSLFDKIKILLFQSEGFKEILQNIIVRKLSQEHYITNVTSSVNKMKLLFQEREEVYKQLSVIDFVEVFNPNNTTSTDSKLILRKLITVEDAKTMSDYVHSIIKILASHCNPSQLEVLCKSALQGNLTQSKIILKQEITNQIKQRTTFMKRVFYLLTGQKADLIKLKAIENAFKEAEIAIEKKDDFKNISMVAAKIKNDINMLYEMQQDLEEDRAIDQIKKHKKDKAKEKEEY